MPNSSKSCCEQGSDDYTHYLTAKQKPLIFFKAPKNITKHCSFYAVNN